VRHADEILVIDNGRVEERGTHEHLLERAGRYARYYAEWRSTGRDL
jgi:ABC-type transport system involved in Fe-S cluster assembly fused permease/ATPase subunit